MFGFRIPAKPVYSTRRLLAALAMLACATGAAQYAPAAEARGFHGGFHGGGRCCGGGVFIGGALFGAAIASSYYYPSYYPPDYYPPAYYPPPAPVTYIEQQPYYDGTQPPAPPPAAVAPPQQLSLEQRVQRLKAMCDQHLFTPQECATRREQLLREM